VTALTPADVAVRPPAAAGARRSAGSAPAEGDAWQRAVACAGGEAAPTGEERADARHLLELQSAQPRPMAVGSPAAARRTPGGSPRMPVSPFGAASSLRWAAGAAPAARAVPSAPVVPATAPADAPAAPVPRGGAGAEAAQHGETAEADRAATPGAPTPHVPTPAAPVAARFGEADAVEEFDLPAQPGLAPVRVHVQWRGRVADVWIGLHRALAAHLPAIRAQIDSWLASRGGTLGQLTCNGDVLETRVAPSSQGDL